MRGNLRCLLQCGDHDLFHLVSRNRGRTTRSGLINQAIQTMFKKAFAPLVCRAFFGHLLNRFSGSYEKLVSSVVDFVRPTVI